MFNLLRIYFDGMAERAAEKLLQADHIRIEQWRVRVKQNIRARSGRWADVAYLKRVRDRRYA